MCNLLLLSLGPALGLQLLHALLHHIYPILWCTGILVPPFLCQVRERKVFPLDYTLPPPVFSSGGEYITAFRLALNSLMPCPASSLLYTFSRITVCIIYTSGTQSFMEIYSLSKFLQGRSKCDPQDHFANRRDESGCFHLLSLSRIAFRLQHVHRRISKKLICKHSKLQGELHRAPCIPWSLCSPAL